MIEPKKYVLRIKYYVYSSYYVIATQVSVMLCKYIIEECPS